MRRKIKWNQSAIDCYNRGCVCEGCPIKFCMDQPCQMKSAVIDLVCKIGAPPKQESLLKGTVPRQDDIINAILKGHTTKPEIAEYLGMKAHAVQGELSGIYNIILSMGYRFTKRYHRLPELVEILFEIDASREVEK